MKKHPLFIRADASPTIGTGHVMRCIALGQAWEENAEGRRQNDEGASSVPPKQEQRTKNQEPETINEEPGTKNQKPSTKNQEPRTKNQERASAHVVFICAELPEKLEERLHKEGFAVERITATPGSEANAKSSLEVVRRYLPIAENSNSESSHLSFIHYPLSFSSWFVLDGYQFDVNYHRAIRSAGLKLMVIDDYNHLPEYECDILLNQNLGAEEYQYSINSDAKMLLGTKYVLLRREFRDAARKIVEYEPRKTLRARKINSNDWRNDGENFQSLEKSGEKLPMVGNNILVTMGGGDSENVTQLLLDCLHCYEKNILNIKVLLGSANPWHDELNKCAGRWKHKVELVPSQDRLAPLMAWADMAISSASSTCWELLVMNVPLLMVVVAKNQETVAENLTNQKLAVSAGWYDDGAFRDTFLQIFDALKIKAEHSVGETLPSGGVDAMGVFRIISEMLSDELSLRDAAERDVDMLLRWANDKAVRKSAFNSEHIEKSDHFKWFESKLNSKNNAIFIAALKDGTEVGQIRFDWEDDSCAEVDVSVDRCFRGKGLASKIIRAGCVKLLLEHHITSVKAVVKSYNIASVKSFERAGFVKSLPQVFSADVVELKWPYDSAL